ncbi:MAG: hypothetical protein U5K30_17700 [Acidimicrobiales bacterium]|nr:hypothetical protein [Acidimicrobiales bacterium]
MVLASFHLIRYPTGVAARRLPLVPLDRRALRARSGARFVKLLGTGRGQQLARSADLRRWAVFATWPDRVGLESFLASSLTEPWDEAEERYDVVLDPIGAHGSWDGVDPIAGTTGEPGSGPIAVLTRAMVRWRRVPTFLRAVPAVDDATASAGGLLAAAGIGELPVGRQATFSLWRDEAAVRDFAYREPRHAEVIERARDEGWYGEEWFARFRPVESSGTWDGIDPLGSGP